MKTSTYQFIHKYKAIIISFLLPFISILFILTLSSLLVNHLKTIQHASITAIYNWEKLNSFATERYNLNRNTSEDNFNLRLADFDESIRSLREALPKWIFWTDITEQADTSIQLWQHIQNSLNNNEKTYQELIATRLGQHLLQKKISEILASEFSNSSALTDFTPYSFFLFNKVESDFEVLLTYITSEAFFENRLLSLNNTLEGVVNLLINIILVMAVLISIFVMFSVIRSINNRLLEQKENEERLSQILESIGDGMIVFSSDLSVVKMNPIAEKILATEFIKDTQQSIFQQLFSKTLEKSNTLFLTALQSHNSNVISAEMTLVNFNNKEVEISASISPMIDSKNSTTGIVFVFQDITQRKQQEKELRDHKLNLEALVDSRTVELQQSLTNLKDAQRQLVESEKMSSLGSLVAGVSHEINTPIGIAVTAASIILKDASEVKVLLHSNTLTKSKFEVFTDQSIESSTMLLANLQRAAKLIQSFKKVAVDQSSEELRSFNLGEYIDEIILSTHSKFKHTRHSVNALCEQDFLINSYPGAISQIITNLLINSLVHGFENIEQGKIDICIEQQGDRAVINYHDNGIGIPHENLNKIFDPFFTTKRGQGGSGLGMNIVYNLTTQTLKGAISCSSAMGNGTRFIIHIPINVEQFQIPPN